MYAAHQPAPNNAPAKHGAQIRARELSICQSTSPRIQLCTTFMREMADLLHSNVRFLLALDTNRRFVLVYACCDHRLCLVHQEDNRVSPECGRNSSTFRWSACTACWTGAGHRS
jgi:hypothetical protein